MSDSQVSDLSDEMDGDIPTFIEKDRGEFCRDINRLTLDILGLGCQ